MTRELSDYLSYVGAYDSAGFDYKRRLVLPRSLTVVYEARMRVQNLDTRLLYYCQDVLEGVHFIEIWDNLLHISEDEACSWHVSLLDRQNRCTLDSALVGVFAGPLKIVGYKDSIRIYKKEDWARLQNHAT